MDSTGNQSLELWDALRSLFANSQKLSAYSEKNGREQAAQVTFHGRAVPVKRQPRLLDTLLP